MKQETGWWRVVLVFLKSGFFEINETAEEIHLLYQPESGMTMNILYQLIPRKTIYVTTSRKDKTIKFIVQPKTVRDSDPDQSAIL